MTVSQPFNFITRTEEADTQLFDEYRDLTSAHVNDINVQLLSKLRKQHPDLIVTTVPASNCNLTQYALAGHAAIELDIETDNVVRYRGYVPANRRGETGDLAEAISFAKFKYSWKDNTFVMYTIGSGYYATQFVLAEPRDGEKQLGHSSITDALLREIGEWINSDREVVYVFDGYWQKSKTLWNEMRKSSWDKVILDPTMKKELVEVANKFFDSKDIYKQFGVPWKRGLIFYGPPGNGKTISVKTLMHTLDERKESIPSLYVKSAYGPAQVRSVFVMARNMAPCMLVMEDMENIVYGAGRSYFFNEIDGLENNDGILFIGTTNYIERLDPGITKRPSRFDRKYLFPLPSNNEREQYCEYWRKKVVDNPQVDYPKKLVKLIAAITFGFSFAYMQEAFIATLLELARQQVIDITDFNICDKDWNADLGNATSDLHSYGGNGDDDDDDDDDDIDKLPFWRVIREQVSVLREDLSRDSAGTEQDHELGLLSLGRKCWDAAFNGLFQGMSRYFQGGAGIGEESVEDLVEPGRMAEKAGMLPEARTVDRSVGSKGRTLSTFDLPVLFHPKLST